jgi:sulfatase maturation enzyme AslB (radical SAM superfamily)
MNNYYCVLPFYSVETEFRNPNKNIFCCRLPANTNIADVQNSILRQERSPSCSTCWKLEDQGLKSERQIHNETMDFLLDLNLDNIEAASIAKGFSPVKIKLATSNLCNGQCVTCNSTLSSSWAALENRSSKYKSLDFTKLYFDIEWDKIVSLSFVGGEPLLEKKNFEILETLVAKKNTNCFISIVTNGSIELTKSQILTLKKFTNLNICVSIDGTGDSFEYMRYPLKWDKLIANLALFKTMSDVSVSCMISNLNIYYYSTFVEFFKENQINYLCKQVTNPSLFSPSNLPNEVKDLVRTKNHKYLAEVNAFMSIEQYRPTLYALFKTEIARQHKLKGIDMSDYMPEVAYLL